MKTSKFKRKLQSDLWNYFWKTYQLPEITLSELNIPFHKYEPNYLDDICLPPFKGNKAFEDYSTIISIIKGVKPKRILELGTAHGNTVANFCVESNAEIFTVNALPEQIEGNLITYTLNKSEIGRVYRKYGFIERVVQIYENTRNLRILKYIPEGSIDLAFIDACHDADFVVNDFQKILPALSDRAIVLFHDTHPSVESHLLDSYLGCMYLRKMGFNIKHIQGTSLGIFDNKQSKTTQPFFDQIRNTAHTKLGRSAFGSDEAFIKELRWLASGFIRGKFGIS
jgi:hypothetical protein